MATAAGQAASARQRETPSVPSAWETAFGYARNFLNNRFVYVVVSPRAHGLSVGINLNPNKECNFDCVYCEVDRHVPARDQELAVPVMVRELEQTLECAAQGRMRALPGFNTLPAELLQLRHVAISGDGEPTLSPHFCDAIHAVVHLRALGRFPFFKLVLLSNATGLDQPRVQEGLQCLMPQDELWLKLDGGTKDYIDRVDRPSVPLEKVLENILLIGRQRSVVIQSLFLMLNGEEPPEEEIAQFVARLCELKQAGARISLVQIYSAMRPTMHSVCGHLPLRSLSRIAHQVRSGAGLRAEVY